MSIVSLIYDERTRYVDFFDLAVRSAKSENPVAASELLISVNDESIQYPYRYLRLDLIGKTEANEDKVYELWLDPDTNVDGKGFDLGGLTLEIYPFTWCGAQIAFDKALPDEEKLKRFLTEWLDIADERADPDSGLSNAIHSATHIETNGQLWFLTIDFGTASSDALLDLIDLLSNEGMTRIIITSS
jgi:hypothetical protein